MVLAAVMFGVPLAGVALWLSSRTWSRPKRVVALVLIAVAIWVPCGYLTGWICDAIPLDWGHASIAQVIGYFSGSLLAAIVIITWLARRDVLKGR